MASSTSNSSNDHSETDAYPRTVRLQRYLARSGAASRRAAENLMTAGRVTVNGEVVTELGSKVNPDTDIVALDGVEVVWETESVVIALNKPAGIISTMSDPGNKPCVAALVPTDTYPGLFPIGRLDRATSGLLLFSTDGDLGHALLHPSHHVDKTYRVQVQGKVLRSQIERLEQGVVIEDQKVGEFLTAPSIVEFVTFDNHTTTLLITIHEGRYHQIRKMCDAIGHTVLDLKRITFGPVHLNTLEEGRWRHLTAEERTALYSAAGLAC